jgi:putative redox protein
MKRSEVRVRWLDKLQFVGIDSARHSLVMSSQDEENGIGVSPTELLLLALGGCTAIDIVNIMKKKRQVVTNLEVIVGGEKSEILPTCFDSIHVEYIVHGSGLQERDLAQAIELSENKYCTVGNSLSCEVKSSYRIVERH